jgi:hypothetical protein
LGLLDLGIGSIADLAKTCIEKWGPQDPAEKAQATLEMQRVLQERENAVVNAQKEIIVSEMSQGDAYTKRTRPTVVYTGLVFILLVHVVFPLAKASIILLRDTPPEAILALNQASQISLPDQFWWAWTGLCGIWMIGRSREKLGITDKLTSFITDSKAPIE